MQRPLTMQPFETEVSQVVVSTGPLNVRVAKSFAQRLRGLIGRSLTSDDEAILIAPCSSVHTCFMREAIDVVFVDRSGRIERIVESIKPWRAAACVGAYAVFELKSGAAQRYGWVPGSRPERLLRVIGPG